MLTQRVLQPHIAEYCHAQGNKIGEPVEIFMILYSGTVAGYVDRNPHRRRDSTFLNRVFVQMLKALMFIAHHGIVHRDVKPDNILWHDNDEGTQFVLADFDFSAEQMQARTLEVGTPMYTAPEIRVPGAPQTHKVDVYSLGVTMLAISGAGGFDTVTYRDLAEVEQAKKIALEQEHFRFLEKFLREDPTARPSAQGFYLKRVWADDPEALKLTPQENEAAAAIPKAPLPRLIAAAEKLPGVRPTKPSPAPPMPARAGVFKPGRSPAPFVRRAETPAWPRSEAVQIFSKLLNQQPQRRRFT
jgi:serine/threonine protein kinase